MVMAWTGFVDYGSRSAPFDILPVFAIPNKKLKKKATAAL